MIKTKRISVTVNIDLEIDTDKLDYGILGGSVEDFTEQELMNQVVGHFLTETDYTFSSSSEAIKVIKAEHC